MNSTWKYMTGILEITVTTLDEYENAIKFKFNCYASPEVNNTDRLDNISAIGYHMAILLNCHNAEIIDIKEVK